MSNYLGFDVDDMLYWLGKYCVRVDLSKVDDEWRLYVISYDHGEYEQVGSIFRLVSDAFKPFTDRAKREVEKNRLQLIDRVNG
jgi:hypothetical protein